MCLKNSFDVGVGMVAMLLGIAGAFGAGTIELRSGDAILGLDAGTGSPIRFADVAAKSEFAVSGEALFRLVVIPPGGDPAKPLELSSRDAKSVRRLEGEGLRLHFEKIGGRNIAAICTIQPGPDRSFHFHIKLVGDAGTVVERVDYPMVSLRAPLKGEGADDAAVLGTTKGGVFERPHQWKPGRQVTATQPGNLAAQFGCYYNTGGGVMTYCGDSTGHPKALVAARTADGLALGWRHPMRCDLGGGVELEFPVVMGSFRGKDGAHADWRDAAAIYKSWALKQPWCAKTFGARDDLPNWLKEGPAQVRFGREWMSQPERIETWLQKYWQKHFSGVPLIVTFWGWEGVATWAPPQYFPPYPSEEGLRRCVEAVRKAGGHVFFWPSGYQWCLTYGKREDGSYEWEDRKRFEQEAKPHAMAGRDGKILLSNPRWYRGGEAATLCRGDKWSRDWFTGVAVELAKRGGELFQIDQVVGAGMRFGGDCRATTHGHPPGLGQWDIKAAHDQMAEMSAACRGAGVNMVLGFEEPQELFLQEVGIQDYRDYEIATRSPKQDHRAESIFGYLYHEFVPLFQSNPIAMDRNMTAHCIVTGQMPHLVPHWPVEPHEFLTNGDFEEWVGEVPGGWEHVEGWKDRKYSGRPHRDDAVRHAGQSSLRIETARQGEITQVSRNLPVGPGAMVPGKKYRLSAWLRVGRLEKPAAIGIAALGVNLRSAGSWKLPFPRAGEWKEVTADVLVPMDGSTVLRIMIHVDGPCQVWIDDFRVSEFGSDGVARPVILEGLPTQHDLYRQWVRLYHAEGRPYLQLGKAVPPPSIDGAVPISMGAFQAEDGSRAAIAVNRSGASANAMVRWNGAAKPIDLGPWEVKLIRW